jgi:hypothetical protein
MYFHGLWRHSGPHWHDCPSSTATLFGITAGVPAEHLYWSAMMGWIAWDGDTGTHRGTRIVFVGSDLSVSQSCGRVL